MGVGAVDDGDDGGDNDVGFVRCSIVISDSNRACLHHELIDLLGK